MKNTRKNKKKTTIEIMRFILHYVVPVFMIIVFTVTGTAIGFGMIWNEAGQYWNMDYGIVIIPACVVFSILLGIVANQYWLDWLRFNKIIK